MIDSHPKQLWCFPLFGLKPRKTMEGVWGPKFQLNGHVVYGQPLTGLHTNPSEISLFFTVLYFREKTTIILLYALY